MLRMVEGLDVGSWVAVQQSWNWEPEVERLFFIRIGEIFWPLYDHLNTKDGIILDEPARHAIWAIYTETLRHHVTSVPEADLPNTKGWIEKIEPQIDLLFNGLKSQMAI
jgi:hypothetical protein